MRHKKYESLIVLKHYGETSPAEEMKLDRHLSSCVQCREFRDDMARVIPSTSASREKATETTLEEARKSFHRALREENRSLLPGGRVRWSSGSAERFRVPVYAMAVVAVVMLAIGALSSYFYMSRSSEKVEQGPGFLSALSPQNQDSMAISDVKFISTDRATGEVKFSFNFIKRYEMKGSLEDRDVQKVLAYALVNSDNPGTRIRTIGVLDASAAPGPDKEVKEALLKAATTDENVGVRRQALVALQKLPFDADVRDAVLAILRNDANPGLRVAAINFISEKEFNAGTQPGKFTKVDPKVLNVLKEKSSSDQNKYVRLKAADMLKELTEL